MNPLCPHLDRSALACAKITRKLTGPPKLAGLVIGVNRYDSLSTVIWGRVTLSQSAQDGCRKPSRRFLMERESMHQLML